MKKKIEKVVISLESIDVIAIEDGVNSITQLNLKTQRDEIGSIFEKYNLNRLTNFEFDINILRALADNEEQITDYLEVCRRANYSKGKVEAPENFPDIEYDLNDLKKVQMPIEQKLEIYRQAKDSHITLKKADIKVAIKMNMLDRGYFSIQELLQSRSKNNQVLALDESKPRRNIREELYKQEYEELTNIVSQEYADKIAEDEKVSETVYERAE